MSDGYVLAQPTTTGAQPRMVCTLHADCKWFFPVVGQRPANDAILKMQFAHHVREHAESQAKILGHQRRRRL